MSDLKAQAAAKLGMDAADIIEAVATSDESHPEANTRVRLSTGTDLFIKLGKAKAEEAKESKAPAAPTGGDAGTPGLDSLSFNDLRKLAKERGIKVPSGTKKPALVKLLS